MISLKEAIEREYQDRMSYDSKRAPNYGIRCLDDSLRYILPNDLVVIGADTGRGKSELAIHIAKHNAKNGKNVYLFSLEGGESEAIKRFKWGDFLNEYYKKHNGHVNYCDWVTNNLPIEVTNDIELNILPKKYEQDYGNNIHIYPMHNKFNIDDVYLSLANFLNEGVDNKKAMFNVDLIIIDHLHYFNLEEDTKSPEAAKLTAILKRCKEITDLHHIPIVLISHLRKKNAGRGIPDNEDFHGSSNIPKIASTAIVIAPVSDANSDSTLIYPTYFRVTKSRVGIKSSFVMKTNFDLKNRKYSEEYEIYPLNENSFPVSEPLKPYQLPYWAKKNVTS